MNVNGFGTGAGRWSVWMAVLGCLAILPACDVTIVSPNSNSNTNDNESPGSQVPDPKVTLVVGNLTSVAVDAEIYISTNGPGISAEELFVAENKFTDGIGLASSGVMEPTSDDRVEIPCADGLVIGTAGGRFLDPDTGDELGSGPPRILQEGLVFDCEATLTLVFRVEDGDFTVAVALE